MKNILIILSVFILSCKAEADVSPAAFGIGVEPIIGNWELSFYDNTTKVPYPIIMSIKKHETAEGLYVISGKGPVNFFKNNCKIDFEKKKIEMGTIQGTLIAGTVINQKNEDDFLDKLSKTENYEISNNATELKFWGSSKTKNLIFKLSK